MFNHDFVPLSNQVKYLRKRIITMKHVKKLSEIFTKHSKNHMGISWLFAMMVVSILLNLISYQFLFLCFNKFDKILRAIKSEAL